MSSLVQVDRNLILSVLTVSSDVELDNCT